MTTTTLREQVRAVLLDMRSMSEGVYDQAIFKAIVLVGGPASGKSTLVGYPDSKEKGRPHTRLNLGLISRGLNPVTSDRALMHLLRKSGHAQGDSVDIGSMDQEHFGRVRRQAKSISERRQDLWIEGRLGLVYESTFSRGVGATVNNVKRLRDLGYDAYLIGVNATLEVALERNRNRARVVTEDYVRKAHAEFETNYAIISKLFPRRSRHYLESSNDLDTMRKRVKVLNSKVGGWLDEPPQNDVAKTWIQAEMERKRSQSR